MEIAIIGGGFTGLTAAYELSRAGHKVTIFEKEAHLGGLAYGFRQPNWQWHIEAAYHHLFTNDRAILTLIRELGLSDKLIIRRPVTSTLWKGNMYQLDSAFHLLAFPGLSLIDKLRTAIALGFLKLFPFWRRLEQITAEHFLISIGGIRAWKTIWEPLLYGKFGSLAPSVACSWFWARIVKRTPKLCYIEGGFHTLVMALEKAITSHKGTIYRSTAIDSIQHGASQHTLLWGNKKKSFDRVLLTLPTPLAVKIAQLPHAFIRGLQTIPHLYAQTLILETDKPVLSRVYWLNVTDRTFPYLAVVAHTNFMSSIHYGNRHLTYFGNYLPHNHPYLSMSKEQLFKIFKPYITRLAPNAKFKIFNSFMFVGPFAQPVHQLNYSKKIPSIETPVTGIYLANMDYVFPWDRGTNYAVELGARAARSMTQ